MSETGEIVAIGTLTLKICNVSTYMTKIGQRIHSPQRQVAGLGWHVLVYPSVVDKTTYLSCFLVGTNAFKWSASVDATFRIVKKYGGFGKENSFRKQPFGKEPLAEMRGWPKFVGSEEVLAGFVIDDSVEIRVDVVLKAVFFSIFEQGQSPAADMKLLVGDCAFYVNKGYLSVMSSVFRETFALSDANAEKDKDGMEQLTVKDVSASEFKEFLGVIYPTRYPITDANVISVFRLADRYDVQHIITDCETYLADFKSVPWFDKLKLTNHLIAMVTCDDIQAIKQAENVDQLGDVVLRAVFEKHVGIHH
ncbi:Protein BATH-38 [Aphelenchoides avenae]|nr:Protein BATH-38 [Aphelenchus avenae]